ncbi:exosome complex exonuclease RRP6 [Nematocida sp. AWRm80]|nr:exosome complex exonuclease RRP6 [Nematocida sp. AWRm80]
MGLTQAIAKLQSTIEKYSAIIDQERLLLSPTEWNEKSKECLSYIQTIEETIDIDIDKSISGIEQALEIFHRECSGKRSSETLDASAQNTILLKNGSLKFILSKNVPRPQVNFKNKQDKYTALFSVESAPRVSVPIFFTPKDIFHIHQAITLLEISLPTECIFINDVNELESLNRILLEESIIGIEVKSHRFRSYKGFSCYLCISTHTMLYVIDCISLRDSLSILNVLESKDTIKILYKMNKKKSWIESDLNCQLNSAIDLSSLSEPLIPALSLVQMIREYLGISIRKEFHLLDWRHRPVTREMHSQLYLDTIYLLPLAKCILSKLSFETVSEILSQPIEPFSEPNTPEYFSSKYNLPLTDILSKVFLLRDFIAKQEDESPQFVLTDRQLSLLISHSPKTPEEAFSILPKISPLFKANINNFFKLLHPTTSSSFSIPREPLK